MANVNLTEFAENTTPADGDLLHSSQGGIDLKLLIQNLATYVKTKIGAVIKPSSAPADGDVAVFDGITGALIKSTSIVAADVPAMAAAGGTNQFVKTATTDKAQSKSNGPGSTAGGYFFTDTGSPNVRIKKLSGTTAAAEGGNTAVAHGLTGDKIIGIMTVVRNYSGNANAGVPHAVNSIGGTSYNVLYNDTNVYVFLHATDSDNILSKAFVHTIFYEE